MNRIKWLSSTKQLVYLFNQLMVYKFIPKNDKPHKLLEEHITDIRGNCPSNGCLRTSLNNVRNNKSIQIIDNIIQALENKKD